MMRSCPLCHSSDSRILSDLWFSDFDGASLDPRVALLECRRCGQVFNNGIFSREDLETYYREETLYAAEMGVGSGGMSQWDQMRYAVTLKAIEPHITGKDAAIVDVGCAKGGFLSFLHAQGYKNLRGIDINIECVNFIRAEYGIDADTGTVDSIPVPDKSADVIVYSHVFEHLFDPFPALEEARRVLKNDGLLFIEVPDAARYADFPVSYFYWLSQREHINHFDADHLRATVQRIGFTPVEEHSFEMFMAANVANPLTSGIYRNTGCSSTQIATSFRLGNNLMNYLAGEYARVTPLQEHVAAIAKSGRPVYVWGIGLEFFTAYALIGLRKCNIKLLIDKNSHKQKRTVDNLKISGPESLKGISSDAVVVITSALHRVAMEAYLMEIGFKGNILVLA